MILIALAGKFCGQEFKSKMSVQASILTRQPVIAVAVASEWVGSTHRSSEEASKRRGAGKRAKSRRKSGCWAMPCNVACKPSEPDGGDVTVASASS